MRLLLLTVTFILAAAVAAEASWQNYRDDSDIAAAYDIASFAPFRGKPSVWVRWNYTVPQNGTGGMKLQFTADCAMNKLYEIDVIPYDADGDYLEENQHYDAPKEYPVTPGSLNEATYNLLCR